MTWQHSGLRPFPWDCPFFPVSSKSLNSQPFLSPLTAHLLSQEGRFLSTGCEGKEIFRSPFKTWAQICSESCCFCSLAFNDLYGAAFKCFQDPGTGGVRLRGIVVCSNMSSYPCVGKFFHLTGPWFPHQQNKMITLTSQGFVRISPNGNQQSSTVPGKERVLNQL